MSEVEKLRAAIDASPRDHAPRLYEVALNKKVRNKMVLEHYRYVRASSIRRAQLAALLVDRTIFGYTKTIAGSATLVTR